MLLQGEGGETPTDVENKIYFVVVKCPVHRIVLYIAFTTGHMGPGMLRKSNSVDDKRGLGLETVYLRLKFFRKTDTYFFFFFTVTALRHGDDSNACTLPISCPRFALCRSTVQR